MKMVYKKVRKMNKDVEKKYYPIGYVGNNIINLFKSALRICEEDLDMNGLKNCWIVVGKDGKPYIKIIDMNDNFFTTCEDADIRYPYGGDLNEIYNL